MEEYPKFILRISQLLENHYLLLIEPLEVEVKRLRRELKIAKQERDILKKEIL